MRDFSVFTTWIALRIMPTHMYETTHMLKSNKFQFKSERRRTMMDR